MTPHGCDRDSHDEQATGIIHRRLHDTSPNDSASPCGPVEVVSGDASLAAVETIYLPDVVKNHMIRHALRKLSGQCLPGEHSERKAFGLLGGVYVRADAIQLLVAFPLMINRRYDSGLRSYMNRVVTAVGVPSETPFDRRGWVADPSEVLRADADFSGAGAVMVGAYHMHRVPWPEDPIRDSCTELDRVLAFGSGIWTFILSMVNPTEPRIRAFFEGSNEREASVVLVP